MIASINGTKITKGEGSLGKVYERLRKRSYRKAWKTYQATVYMDDMAFDNWLDTHQYWGELDHAVYLQGVRDALKEVSKL